MEVIMADREIRKTGGAEDTHETQSTQDGLKARRLEDVQDGLKMRGTQSAQSRLEVLEPEGVPNQLKLRKAQGAYDEQDEIWMREALRLAENGRGHVSPNPMVGAVIVKDGIVIGQGWHENYGGLHAERNALKDCRRRGNDPQGATIYVSLEPCCHYGKTPPCTEAIIENQLGRVVFGAWDPNPLVAGEGIRILQEAGIETAGPVCEPECLAVNRVFFHYITRGTPYIVMKYAMTADGKIACVTGDSKWVTGEGARKYVHETRRWLRGIMVGINTVLQDDPMLDCRLEDDPVNPVRIICDSRLRMPADSRIAQTADKIPTIVAYTEAGAAELDAESAAESGAADGGEYGMDARSTGAESRRASGVDSEKKTSRHLAPVQERKRALTDCGIELLAVEADGDGHVDLKALMKALGEKKIDGILLEGGSELNFSALRAGIVSEVHVYIAPKMVGGMAAKSPVSGAGIERMEDCIRLSKPEISFFEPDLLLKYRVLEAAIEKNEKSGQE